MANPTFGGPPRGKPRQGIVRPEADISYTVDDARLSTTANRHETAHPWTIDCGGGSVPPLKNLGTAGGGHDDPSKSYGNDPNFPAGTDFAPPAVRGGDLKIVSKGGHDDPSSQASGNDGYPW